MALKTPPSQQYTREELQKLYLDLPQELQNAIFSEETAGYIDEITERHQIPEEQIPEIARRVGRVLMGILPPEKFAQALQEEVGIQQEAAEAVAKEISRFVFQPIRPQLEQLYQQAGEKPLDSAQDKQAQSKKTQRKAPLWQKKERTPVAEPSPASGKDTYREPIEE